MIKASLIIINNLFNFRINVKIKFIFKFKIIHFKLKIVSNNLYIKQISKTINIAKLTNKIIERYNNLKILKIPLNSILNIYVIFSLNGFSNF